MSIIKKLSNLLSKKSSSHVLGLCFRQNSVAYCSIPSSSSGNSDSSNSDSSNSGNSDNNSDEISCQQVEANPADYSTSLTKLHQEHKLKGQCHLVLSAQQAQIVQVDKPNIPEEEINGALKWQVKDLVSFSPDNMVLDYFDGPTLSGGTEKINVVCASLSELRGIVAQLNQNDIQVKSIITEDFAFSRLLPVQEDACLLVCQQPNEEILLLIVKNGRLFFQRRLRGFAQISKQSEEQLAMTVIDALSLEIQRSTDYFERQLKQAPIKSIKVILPLETEAFIARKLAENTHVVVDMLALPEQFKSQRSFAASIGATLGATVSETQSAAHSNAGELR